MWVRLLPPGLGYNAPVVRFWFRDKEEGSATDCPNHRPFVEDDDGSSIVIACPNCDHAHVMQHDTLQGDYTVEIEVEGDLWDAANQYRDLIHELECFAGFAALQYPERPTVVETDKAVA